MKIYIVTREGIYMQGILFISDDKSKAVKTAVELIKMEPDDYHDFRFYEIELNEIVKEELPDKNGLREIQTLVREGTSYHWEEPK